MAYEYDAFITYRGPDAAEANALCDILKHNGLNPALDSRDFSPTQTFLDEMARCVSKSRYTIALISEKYATSHFAREEAIMQQILDSRDDQRRLIVAYLVEHPAPLWMQSRVGIHLYRDKGKNDQPELRKLLRILLRRDEPASKELDESIDRQVDVGWKQLPKQLLELGVYGLAGYGVLSVIAGSTSSQGAADAAHDMLTSAATDHGGDTLASTALERGSNVASHTSDHGGGVVTGIAKAVKNFIDDLW